jgi:hypothetical protein
MVSQEVKMRRKVDSRVGEMVLVILGGILGLVAGLFVLSAGGLIAAFKSGGGEFVWFGIAASLFSVLALVALSFLSSNSKLAGWLVIVAACGGLFFIGLFYILPGMLLFIAGLMCLLRGRKTVALSW